MKNSISASALVVLAAFFSVSAQASGTQVHCFATAAPLICAGANVEVVIQRMDCTHSNNSAVVSVDNQVVSTLESLQIQTEGTPSEQTGLAPHVVYQTQGFVLTADNDSDSKAATLQAELPNGDQILNQDLECNW